MKKILSVIAMLFLITTVACQQKKEQRQQGGPMVMPGPSPQQIEQLQAATRMAPKSAQAWVSLGDAMMDSRRYSEAVDAYQKALELDPKNVNARVDMGTCYRGMGQFDKAVEEYRKALKINPAFPNGHRNLGVVLAYDLKQNKEAITAFQKYLELAPNAPDAAEIRQVIQSLSSSK
jgi:tetratricopeptide (TPR) repeat protein